MSPVVRVQLLGPIGATGPDGPLTLRGKTARTVLARLALSVGSVVSVDQLTDALWGDEPPLDPSLSLRSIVSRLRRQLGADAIVTGGAGYLLEPAVVDVDLAEVEAIIRAGALQDRDPVELSAALGLWTGDALADVAWTTAFEPERVRIAELRAQLIDGVHSAMLERGRAGETLADLERDAAAAPLRESTQLLLMRALDACGRTADALRVGEEYRARLIEQTGLDPSPDHDALTRELLVQRDEPGQPAPGASPPSPARPAINAPWIPPDTPFVGRETALADLDRLAGQRRLVTITGPGGVGKTRLVTEYMASRSQGDAGVEMVSLAALGPSSALDIAVATALGIEVSSADAIVALAARLSARPTTMVLDNCEHVIAGARLLIERLLGRVEDLRIITTSRRRLGLPDEVLFDVGPLDVPATDASDSAPVRLFLDRVERSARTIPVSDQDRSTAADICRLVDGLPLALELAAARIAMFGFDGLRQRLADGLVLPGRLLADDDRRQATIESTVEWSLDLLSPRGRDLFDDLSIFPSWFDLAALEHVSQDQHAVDAFSEILDSSLLRVDHHRPAYRLLEPIRQVAARQIDRERRDLIVTRYLEWVGSIIDAIDERWIDDDRAAAQHLVMNHRADIRWSLSHLAEQGDARSHGRFAFVLARALVDRADVEIIELCRVDVGPSMEGELARCMLAWHQGDLDAFASMVADIDSRIDADHPLWSHFHWIRAAGSLYLGDVEATAGAGSVAAADERGYPSMRSESVALWALSLLYNGRRTEAAAVLADNEPILDRSGSGGFVAYTRAEVVAADDPDLAMSYLEASSAEAAEAMATFSQRLIDVSRLVLLVSAERPAEATGAALDLVPELLRSGTAPQAWTAMRHIADLLGQLGHAELGLLVLDSAAADPGAPAVTGEGVGAEARLRAQLEMGTGDGGGGGGEDRIGHRTPLALAPLWHQVASVLEVVGPSG
jgi:predicted ATPase/DNA-binding SARP family transcriptional activator